MESPKKNASKAIKPKKTDVPKKASKKFENPARKWWEQTRQYLWEVWHELSKVVWPSRKETMGTTGVVLVIVFLMGAFLGIVDLILSRLVGLLIG